MSEYNIGELKSGGCMKEIKPDEISLNDGDEEVSFIFT